MQWLLNCKSKDIPMNGVDWIVLSANALGIAIVVAASLQAQPSHSTNIAADTPSETLELASLD